jgi:hypothetical protein
MPLNTLELGKDETVNALVVINRLGPEFKRLVGNLSVDELNVLIREVDLLERVRDVSNMDEEEIRSHMSEAWGLIAESCQNDDWWIDIEPIRHRLPSWTKAVIEGQYVFARRFAEVGRDMLMQEVRVNINLRLIQLKKEAVRSQRAEESRRLQDEFEQGQLYGGY